MKHIEYGGCRGEATLRSEGLTFLSRTSGHKSPFSRFGRVWPICLMESLSVPQLPKRKVVYEVYVSVPQTLTNIFVWATTNPRYLRRSVPAPTGEYNKNRENISKNTPWRLPLSYGETPTICLR